MRVVQFEFTLWATIARTWLADFYDVLAPLGYDVGKVYPSAVEWRSYQPQHELFVRANFVATRDKRIGETARLAGRDIRANQPRQPKRESRD